MNEIFDNNIALIRQRWPAIDRIIEEVPAAQVVWSDSTPVITMQVAGLQVHSGYQPLEEAELQLRDIPKDAVELTIYGVGMGFLPRIALESHTNAKVRVVPMSLSVFKASLEAIDHQPWLANPRCELVESASENNIRTPFAAIPACLQLADQQLAKLRDQIILELNTPFLARESTVSQARRRKQLEDNRLLIAQDADVQTLFDQSVARVMVAAAGPTLRQSFDWIRAHRSEAQLIAVDAALRPLLDAGIVPDIVVAADADRDNLMKYFRGDLSDCQHIPLVYLPVVHRDVLERWPGPRFTAYTEKSLYDQIREEYPKTSLFMSGSVSHCAVDLGVKSGAEKIILLGFDFSFPGQLAHANTDVAAKQLLQQSNIRSWVLDGHGNKIASAPNLLGYLRDLERYIEAYAEISWINASRDGALIVGVHYLDEGTW